jgi:N-acetyl sugar amidotransferase
MSPRNLISTFTVRLVKDKGLSSMKVVVISSDYPSPEFLYGDVFVHTRLKEYAKLIDVKVIGYNQTLSATREFEYEGISVFITNILSQFSESIKAFNPDVIVGHFIQYTFIDLLIDLQKPLIVFVHGYDALSWKRRLMNYASLSDSRYLWSYLRSNQKQLRAMKKLAALGNKTSNIHFVFVSHWLKKAVEQDWQMMLKNSHIIPNGINTKLFSYNQKESEKRKKILHLRSFKARNYANDIAIDAILLLSTKDFFSDLEFSIYGEGYLFKRLTSKIEHFENVKLYNFFIENSAIPAIHQDHGIFLSPSRLDTQGVSMCEAMSSGLVPITSPIGGIPEYAENGVSSFQVNTPEEVAEKIELLYRNPELFSEMSVQASKAIAQKCPVQETIVKEIELIKSLYTRILPKQKYQQCTQCLLDTHDDSSITFDETGICSYCLDYKKNESKYIKTDGAGQHEVASVIKRIKTAGKNKPYDCIIGLSGGVDSTYLAWKAKELGLRPLAVHFDNGWNSELAVSNIENIVTKLGFDLHTVVINWEEFRNLQLAFLKASVVDIEVVTDHAIFASLYKIAIEKRIQYILSGVNYVTEFILPDKWIHDKRDHIHIKAINDKFGSMPLLHYPLFSTKLKVLAAWRGIESILLLNYYPYNKEAIKQFISSELNWRDYGGKHYESIFTRFYQGYILPTKFGIDKRKAHLSTLINSGQITREKALEQLSVSPYPTEVKDADYAFILKKLKLTDQQFKDIMNLPVKEHQDYEVDQDVYLRYPVLTLLSPLWKFVKRIKGV